MISFLALLSLASLLLPIAAAIPTNPASPCHDHGQQAFDHYRLGNIIDIWVREFVLKDAGVTGADIAAKLNAESLQAATHSSNHTFGKFLAKHPMATFVRTAEKRAWNSTDHCGYWNHTNHWSWWIYSLKYVAEYGVIARPALMRAFDAYFGHHCAHLNHTLGRGALWMAVHVRLGDFVTNRGNTTKWIEPTSMAAAAKAHFVQVPDLIAIFGGGRAFTMSNYDSPSTLGTRSDRLIRLIHTAFAAAFPSARVEFIDEVSPDADFYLLATAPMLVTAAGSYALAASLINPGQRLTPALKNLNFADKGWRNTKRQSVVPGDSRWQTYVGELARIPS